MNIPTNQHFFYKKLDIVKLIVLLYFFPAHSICHSNFSNRILTMLPLLRLYHSNINTGSCAGLTSSRQVPILEPSQRPKASRCSRAKLHRLVPRARSRAATYSQAVTQRGCRPWPGTSGARLSWERAVLCLLRPTPRVPLQVGPTTQPHALCCPAGCQGNDWKETV